TRQGLKDLGDKLDEETNHQWLISAVAEVARTLPQQTPIVVDSIRKAEQLELFRRQVEFEVTHVHLYATRETLERRFKERQESRGSPESAEEMDLVKSEKDITVFKNDADVRIFTD